MNEAVTASAFKNWRTTLERVDKYISLVYFADVNLRSCLYPKSLDVTDVLYAEEPKWPADSPKLCPSQRPSFAHAVAQTFGGKVGIGSSFGPTWSTHWFQVEINIPNEWLGYEVHFRWDAGCEALLWSTQGEPLQGLSGGISHQRRTHYIISKKLEQPEQKQNLYIEMACNTLFGAGKGSMIAPPDANQKFSIKMMEIAIFDREVYNLLVDLEVLHNFADTLGHNSDRAYQALYTANAMINILVLDDRETYARAHKLASDFFAQENGSSQHTIIAIGNCHIDTAWLWPYGETIRKCARSWSSTIRLMKDYDSLLFACSQAQQLYWVKEEYPSLFKGIQELSQQGKFIPVGGTWVEMDGNLPSGESFIRQFLYGQEFFKQEFGKICHEFWLPDTFGYSAQLPQIMKLCGAEYFLSQKLSWSLVNTFPHNTFLWEGIDGTKVITHFPPADTYSANIEFKELFETVNKLKDKGRVSQSMLLYGFGDGGGGPTEDMLERMLRLKDVDRCPKIKVSTPEEFFVGIKDKELKNLNTWVGELYLELHNGTYTTQALTKYHNRKIEFELHNVDFLISIWAVHHCVSSKENKCIEMKSKLDAAWKKLLLNQFHDVLPGSSIGDVYKEAIVLYKDIAASNEAMEKEILTDLFGESCQDPSQETELIVINTLSWERTEVLKLCNASGDKMEPPECRNLRVTVPAFGFAFIKTLEMVSLPIIEPLPGGKFSMKNECISVLVDSFGRILSLKVVGCDKEAIAPGCFANQFVLYDDVPLYWDAWDVMDYHLETGKPVLKVASSAELSKTGTELLIELHVGEKSLIKVEVSLLPKKPYLSFKINVNWNEKHKFLKVEFPVNVHSSEATYDIQFGHLKRPTHFNTSWDWAKYEVCGHKWVDLSEHNWGIALLNDCKYGHSVHKNVMKLSLLRSPKSPDDQADMGLHEIKYAVMPHEGTLQEAGVIKESYAFNAPLKSHCVTSVPKSIYNAVKSSSLVYVDHPGIVIETVKMAQKIDNAFIVRMYESFGGRCVAKLSSLLPIKSTVLCNCLEDEIESTKDWDGNGVSLPFTPFQIINVMMQY